MYIHSKKRIHRTGFLLFCLICVFIMSSSTVHAASYQAKIGKKKYKTVQKAVNKVKNGQTIKLLKNVKLKNGTVIKVNRNVKFVFDMNGKTISKKIKYRGMGSSYVTLIKLSKGTMTVKNGTLKSDTGFGTGIIVMGKAKAIIEGGTYRLQIEVKDQGNLTIKKGSFLNKRVPCIYQVSGAVTIHNGTFQSNENCIILYKGKTVINGGKYASLSEEYPCIYQHGGTLIMNKGSLTSNNECLHMNGGKATINGGTIAAKDNWAIFIEKKADLNINNCKLNISERASSEVGVGGIITWLDADATVRISGGTFSSKGGRIINCFGGKLSISGGEFTIAGAENEIITTEVPTVISGGVFKSAVDECVLSCEDDILISGGTFITNDCPAVIADGKFNSLSITGGTFKNASDEEATIDSKYPLKKLTGAKIKNSGKGGTVYVDKLYYDEDESLKKEAGG